MQYSKILMPKNEGLSFNVNNPYIILGVQQSLASQYIDNGLIVQKCWGEDIPGLCDFYTEKGIPVKGVTGDDFLEIYRLQKADTSLRKLRTIEWVMGNPYSRYMKPTLCLIGVDSPQESKLEICVNKRYTELAKKYLAGWAKDRGIVYQIRSLTGEVENELPDNADLVVEIVCSGTTLAYRDRKRTVPREPKLQVLKEFFESDMCVITSWPE